MEEIIRIGMDTSKHVFQLHGANAAEQPILRKKMRRKEMLDFFAHCPPTVIAIEACGASYHWARLLTELGHDVKLIAPQLVKPYVKRGKNDATDAEAMSRPTMRFVPVKSTDQQAALMLVGMRERAVAAQTAACQYDPGLCSRVRADRGQRHGSYSAPSGVPHDRRSRSSHGTRAVRVAR